MMKHKKSINIEREGEIMTVTYDEIESRLNWLRNENTTAIQIINSMGFWGYTKLPRPDGNPDQWFVGWTSPTGQVFGVWDDTPEGAVRSAAVMALRETNTS